MDRLIRPAPLPKIEDYDDGDPYSCMAAGRAELDMQRDWQRRVEECFEAPPEKLEQLLKRDRGNVKGALFDLWMDIRKKGKRNALSGWAAAQLEELGYPWLAEYDREH